jgi:hypothetical protein
VFAVFATHQTKKNAKHKLVRPEVECGFEFCTKDEIGSEGEALSAWDSVAMRLGSRRSRLAVLLSSDDRGDPPLSHLLGELHPKTASCCGKRSKLRVRRVKVHVVDQNNLRQQVLKVALS